METVRPHKVLQLGLGDGLIYMALCQAAERLGGQTLCLGIDPGGSPLPAALRAQHDAQYADISTLLPAGLPAEGGRLARNVDILVLNTALSDEHSQIILKSWLPQLSRRAVVLTCDSIHILGSADLRRALLDESKHSIIEGPLSPGGDLLDVTLYGPDQPGRLRRLASSNDTSAMQLTARQVFGRLGQGVEDAWELAALKSDFGLSVHREDDLQEQIADLEHALANARRQADMLRRTDATERTMAEAAASRELARGSSWQEERSALTARITEFENLLDASQKESALKVEELQKQKSAVETQLAIRIEEIDVLKQQSEALSGEVENLHKQKSAIEAQHASRIEDIAVLMQHNKTQLDEVEKAHRLSLETLHNDIAKSESKLAALSKEKTEIGNDHGKMMEAVYLSTSWRVTRPLRSLKLAFKR